MKVLHFKSDTRRHEIYDGGGLLIYKAQQRGGLTLAPTTDFKDAEGKLVFEVVDFAQVAAQIGGVLGVLVHQLAVRGGKVKKGIRIRFPSSGKEIGIVVKEHFTLETAVKTITVSDGDKVESFELRYRDRGRNGALTNESGQIVAEWSGPRGWKVIKGGFGVRIEGDQYMPVVSAVLCPLVSSAITSARASRTLVYMLIAAVALLVVVAAILRH
jgi:hypothetical protein